jgi:23S rRNA (cytosine1962-C5)-methyltransferase
LHALREAKERFDVVIVDPPAFIKRRKDYYNGLKAYRQLNEAAMRVLNNKDGILISASCSYHLNETDFLQTLLAGARHLDRTLQIMEFGQQAPDHPVHPAIPETRYLKTAFVRVLPASGNP